MVEKRCDPAAPFTAPRLRRKAVQFDQRRAWLSRPAHDCNREVAASHLSSGTPGLAHSRPAQRPEAWSHGSAPDHSPRWLVRPPHTPTCSPRRINVGSPTLIANFVNVHRWILNEIPPSHPRRRPQDQARADIHVTWTAARGTLPGCAPPGRSPRRLQVDLAIPEPGIAMACNAASPRPRLPEHLCLIPSRRA
jgi:hypothetical protein